MLFHKVQIQENQKLFRPKNTYMIFKIRDKQAQNSEYGLVWEGRGQKMGFGRRTRVTVNY